MKEGEKDYLGDGVYIEHQGHQIRLYTSNGVTEGNSIYLDGSVIQSLARALGLISENNLAIINLTEEDAAGSIPSGQPLSQHPAIHDYGRTIKSD